MKQCWPSASAEPSAPTHRQPAKRAPSGRRDQGRREPGENLAPPRSRTVRFTIFSRVNYEFATPRPRVPARLRTMAALREIADILSASGLEIRPAEGLVLASGRALGAPNVGSGFSASTSPHATRACAATAATAVPHPAGHSQLRSTRKGGVSAVPGSCAAGTDVPSTRPATQNWHGRERAARAPFVLPSSHT